MREITVISGSRADAGILAPVMETLSEVFDVQYVDIRGLNFQDSFTVASRIQSEMALVLGDRFEILAAVCALHLNRVPIAHIGGGDVTEGSYDDAMRDCITRMAKIHFCTSELSAVRLIKQEYQNVHLVGNPAIDYIKTGTWKSGSPIPVPYVVVSYQPETIDGAGSVADAIAFIGDRYPVFIPPNPDRGSDKVKADIQEYLSNHRGVMREYALHSEFLNLIFHCEEFIGNSSAIFYEAPAMGVKTRLVGKRQKGRVIPWGDGQSSQRIRKVLEAMP